MDNFAAFILTNRRSENLKTLRSLKKNGYTGKVYLVVDNQDPTINKYKEKYGDIVIEFDKNKIAESIDTADNFKNMGAIIYARNACFEIAKKLNIEYFIQLDDDYTDFEFRFNSSFCYKYKSIRYLDDIFYLMVKFLKETNIKSIAMAQGGDFIGGKDNRKAKSIFLSRKCMNTFVCSTERYFQFTGKINEDVNTYTNLASKGNLFLTTNQVSIKQMQSQKSTGGMTDQYLDYGTYIKTFYSVIISPSCVKIATMGLSGGRIHHHVNWNNTAPKIIREDIKKA